MLDTDDAVEEFVRSHLPPAPGRVLEVGCGEGELALALSGAGYDVLAIDPDPPAGSIFRRSTIEELAEPGRFDAVVASCSLHHVFDLRRAVERIAALLRTGGVVIVDEFAWEGLDEPAAAHLGISLGEWRDEHEHLHTSGAMLAELDRRFSRRSFSREPYLFREARQTVTEEAERVLIERGDLEPIGFRYVGVR